MKTTKKLLLFALSAILALGAFAFVSCGETDNPGGDPGIENPGGDNPGGDNPGGDNPGDDSGIDFSAYTKEQFLAEDFSSKEISYQLTGFWDELPEFQNGFGFLYNMYADGSLKVDQVNIYTGNVYSYYGFWEESNGTFGHEINADTLYMTGLDGNLIAKAVSNSFYEEDGGTYSDKFSFDIAPGMYTRSVEVSGSKQVKYDTLDAYYKEVQKVVEIGKYVSKEAAANGVSAEITVYSNGTMTADLVMAPHGVINRQEGTRTVEYGDAGSVKSVTLTFAHYTEGVKDNEDTVITYAGDAESFTWNANFMGQTMTFEMVAAE